MMYRNHKVLFICYDNESYGEHRDPDVTDDALRSQYDIHTSGQGDPRGKVLFPKYVPQMVIGGIQP